jgi:hypothetical protein
MTEFNAKNILSNVGNRPDLFEYVKAIITFNSYEVRSIKIENPCMCQEDHKDLKKKLRDLGFEVHSHEPWLQINW